ncbi:MAG: PilZ domain-containing protein [Candidatus Omnitrophica bacterium]|nr:PilZ domain-containing protein [Candidatus Omnitrophota bacterium]
MWDGLNHRRFPRLDIKCEVFIRDQESSYTVSTHTENVGAGGVCIVLAKPLRRYSIVEIKLYLGDNLPPVECVGKVVWIIEEKTLSVPERKYDMGVEFLTISHFDRERIRKFLSKEAAVRGDKS